VARSIWRTVVVAVGVVASFGVAAGAGAQEQPGSPSDVVVSPDAGPPENEAVVSFAGCSTPGVIQLVSRASGETVTSTGFVSPASNLLVPPRAPAGDYDVVVRCGPSRVTTHFVVTTYGHSTTLEAAAIANAKAWLTGTVDEIKRHQGPECSSRKGAATARTHEAAALRKLRAGWAQRMGRPLKNVRVLGAQARNVTATSGEAEVEYNLPDSVVGNYNWVTFKRHGGSWQVSDCRLPFGGNAQSAVPATPTS
jgi:hypothetical protein